MKALSLTVFKSYGQFKFQSQVFRRTHRQTDTSFEMEAQEILVPILNEHFVFPTISSVIKLKFFGSLK